MVPGFLIWQRVKDSNPHIQSQSLLSKEKSRNRCGSRILDLAAGEGFEPSHTESESAVLPLHKPAIFILFRCCSPQQQILLYSKPSICQYIFRNFFHLFFEGLFLPCTGPKRMLSCSLEQQRLSGLSGASGESPPEIASFPYSLRSAKDACSISAHGVCWEILLRTSAYKRVVLPQKGGTLL